MILIDANIFVRFSNKDDPLRATAKSALEHLDNQEELVVAPQCLYEFWVVMTRPRQNNGYGFTSAEAAWWIRNIQDKATLLTDDLDVYRHWETLVSDHNVLGKQGHDAHLSHGCIGTTWRVFLPSTLGILRDTGSPLSIRAACDRCDMADEEWDEEREELEYQRDWERRRELDRLHQAVRDGDLEEVERLVAEERNLNLFDDLARTPLHYAAERGHLEVMACLIKAGADVNAHDESRIGETPLGQVAGECSLEVTKMLIEAGADPMIPGWMQIKALYRAEQRANKTGKFKSVYRLLLEASRKNGSPKGDR